MFRAVMLALFAFPAIADDRAAFYGAWGTADQCSGAPIKSGGTVRAQPFEIGPDWIRQGETFCSLEWFPVEALENELFTGAQARCGEDTVIGYTLGMRLSDDALMLRWDFLTSNGPLSRCAGSTQ
ncbi:MAG: hypothetical protein AAGH68_02160 [Pseudomonadota bacterium]